MVNGYVTLDLASKNIYKEALGAIKVGKPVMVVDAPDVYFADTIKTTNIDDDVVVQITKGGKSITINDVNAVSSEGVIQAHVYQISVGGDDSSDNSLYFNAYIFTTRNDLTKENVLNFLQNYFLIGSGHNGTTHAVYTNMKYLSNKFQLENNLDELEEIINIVVNKLVKLI